jgi:hypothetical protein
MLFGFFQLTTLMFAFSRSRWIAWYSTKSGSNARRSIGVRQVQGHAFIKETRESVNGRVEKGFYVRITENIQF